MKRIESLSLSAAVVSMTMLAACQTNSRLEIGDTAGRLVVALPAYNSVAALEPSAVPSVTGNDRTGWATIEFAMPVDEIPTSGPLYRPASPRVSDGTARQRGEHPNAASAVTPSVDAEEQIAEMMLAPLMAAGEILTMPGFIVLTAAGQYRDERYDVYERLPVGPIPPVFFAPRYAPPMPEPAKMEVEGGAGEDGDVLEQDDASAGSQ